MIIDDKLLKNEERAILSLRGLYKNYGYLPFKMSKFEEYDLYLRNKDFLVSDRVITFNDAGGRLLALKPDVTLSIIKNTATTPGVKQKVYYNENVYRVSSGTGQFKEIMQTGLECIGDLDVSDVFEVVYLAARSLADISADFVLDISHMGVLSDILDVVSTDTAFKKAATALISEKNKHELRTLAENHGAAEDAIEKLLRAVDLYGAPDVVMSAVAELIDPASPSYRELSALCDLLAKTDFYGNLRIDFSVVNDMNYYNGTVFRGFLAGIFEGVLAGGEYDSLMRRMGIKSRAVGFAIYLDLLDSVDPADELYDVDVLLLYSPDTPAADVIAEKERLIALGNSVQAQSAIPEKLKYGQLVRLGKENC